MEAAQEPKEVAAADLGIAGEIFGTPVSMGNYLFAKRVALTFHPPLGAATLPPEEQEKLIWKALILHYEAFRQEIQVSEDDVSKQVNEFLKGQKVSWTRESDPEAYREWLQENLRSSSSFFESQIRYLLEINKLKEKVFATLEPEVEEEELKEEFLNEGHHVGGEMVDFETKEEADAFYEKIKRRRAWEKMKKQGEQNVRPVSTMTLEFYMNLWGVPKDQIYAFHAMKIGSVGPPMPFGKKWAVYRLGDKKVADLANFPDRRESYKRQVQRRKKWDELWYWEQDLQALANLKVFVKEDVKEGQEEKVAK